MNIENHMNVVEEMIKTVAKDRRDEWPDNSKSYIKGELLSNGYFGTVKFAECQDPLFGFYGLDVRRCVIKTVYLRRRFESILSFTKEDDLFNKHSSSIEEKLFRFYRKLVLELYVLNRCRHENILHSHAVFFDIDLHIVYPRCYLLQQLIDLYRIRKNSEPIPVKIIAMIIRQLCFALEFLSKIGIIHRDVQPQNVFLTRGGTVKLAHFGQSAASFPDCEKAVCKTPVGRKEFMNFEKLFNLYQRKSVDSLQYSYQSDIWSLGVLVLSMITYFPNEKGHKLDDDFALFMQKEKMPFIWLTAEMLQLRSRIVKSGGEELKLFLSDYLLSISKNKINTAGDLLKVNQMVKWCSKDVNNDKLYLRKYFINEVDFANFFKLEENAPNYNDLETKDIPAEFYWNKKWKQLESYSFLVKILYPNQSSDFDRHYLLNNYLSTVSKCILRFSNPEPLFYFLYSEFLNDKIQLTDIIPLDFEIKELIYDLVKNSSDQQLSSETLRKNVHLTFSDQLNSDKKMSAEIEVCFAPIRNHRMFSSSSTDKNV